MKKRLFVLPFALLILIMAVAFPRVSRYTVEHPGLSAPFAG